MERERERDNERENKERDKKHEEREGVKTRDGGIEKADG